MTEQKQQSIAELAKKYYDLVQELTNNKNEPPPDKSLECLVTRDKIAHLSSKQGVPDPAVANLLDKGDRQLRELKKTVPIGRLKELDNWRKSFPPAPEAWWWIEPPSGFFEGVDWFWKALALTFLAVSLSIIVNISSRFLDGFLDGNPDIGGLIAVVFPTILSLLTTRSILTESGRLTCSFGLYGAFLVLATPVCHSLQ